MKIIFLQVLIKIAVVMAINPQKPQLLSQFFYKYSPDLGYAISTMDPNKSNFTISNLSPRLSRSLTMNILELDPLFGSGNGKFKVK